MKRSTAPLSVGLLCAALTSASALSQSWRDDALNSIGISAQQGDASREYVLDWPNLEGGLRVSIGNETGGDKAPTWDFQPLSCLCGAPYNLNAGDYFAGGMLSDVAAPNLRFAERALYLKDTGNGELCGEVAFTVEAGPAVEQVLKSCRYEYAGLEEPVLAGSSGRIGIRFDAREFIPSGSNSVLLTGVDGGQVLGAIPIVFPLERGGPLLAPSDIAIECQSGECTSIDLLHNRRIVEIQTGRQWPAWLDVGLSSEGTGGTLRFRADPFAGVLLGARLATTLTFIDDSGAAFERVLRGTFDVSGITHTMAMQAMAVEGEQVTLVRYGTSVRVCYLDRLGWNSSAFATFGGVALWQGRMTRERVDTPLRIYVDGPTEYTAAPCLIELEFVLAPNLDQYRLGWSANQ